MPIPAIMRKGKNITPKAQAPPSRSDRISKEKPKSPATMQTRAIPNITRRSLKRKMKIMKVIKRRIRNSLRGALKMAARVSPQH